MVVRSNCKPWMSIIRTYALDCLIHSTCVGFTSMTVPHRVTSQRVNFDVNLTEWIQTWSLSSVSWVLQFKSTTATTQYFSINNQIQNANTKRWEWILLLTSRCLSRRSISSTFLSCVSMSCSSLLALSSSAAACAACNLSNSSLYRINYPLID